MAFESAFRERLRDMEITLNQRLSLLQGEKLLQTNKSLLLSSKCAHIRSLEQQCLLLDHNFASQNFKISSLKSGIEFLERRFQNCAQQLRVLRVDVEDLEQLEEEKEKCRGFEFSVMEEFTDKAERFASEIRCRVEELRCRRDELKSSYMEIQKSSQGAENPSIQVAEIRRSELLALKEKMKSKLDSNKRLRDDLENQMQSLR